jgi:hypothetical protein
VGGMIFVKKRKENTALAFTTGPLSTSFLEQNHFFFSEGPFIHHI